jgi:PAS domain S-box-containing protein
MHFDLLATPATWEVLSKTGKAYFDALVEHLCNITGVAVAFVVESVDPKGERVCPLSIRGVENFRDGRCYYTRGTPCERLRKGGASLFPERLTEHFPEDSWLATTAMQSYVGLPLLDADGNVLGHLAVLDDQPMPDPRGIAAVLEAFVPRSAAELARARQDLGLNRLIGSQRWILYRAAPPRFELDMVAPNGQEFLGFSASEIAQSRDLRWHQLHDNDRERVLAAFSEAMETGRDFVLNYRMWTKDRGSIRRFQDHGHVVLRRDGRPMVIVGALVDITVKRQRDPAGPEAELKLLSRLGDLPGVVFRSRQDTAWTVEFVSGSTRALTGYAPPDLLHNRRAVLSQLIDPADRDRVEGERQRAVRDGTGYQVSYRLWNNADSERMVVETGRGVPKRGEQPGAIEGFIIDHTDQERTLQELRASEERFRRISATAQDAILMLDDAGRIHFWNAAATRIFGYQETEVLGLEVHTLLAPERYRGQARLAMREFARSGTGPMLNTTLSLEALRKDGSAFPVEFSVSPLQLDGHWHVVAIVRDVSDREQALADARESQRRFETLFEEAADGLVIADPETARFVAGNRCMAEYLGCSQEELTRLSVRDIHPEPVLDQVLDDFHRLASEGKGTSLDVPVKRLDGSLFTANVNAFSIEIGDRSLLVGAFRDVTERRQAEQQLMEERLQLQLYLDNSPSITVVFEPDGTIRRINRRGCTLLGYEAEEIVGRNWYRDFIPESARPAVEKLFSSCFQNGVCQREQIDTPVLTREGEQRAIVWRNEIIDGGEGRPNVVLCAGEDVTEQRRMEQELQAVQQRLEFVVRTVPAVLFLCKPEPDLEVIFVGANAEQHLGVAAERVIGHSGLWTDFAHPEDLPSILSNAKDLFENGAYETEFRLRSNGSGYRWVQNALRLVRDASGKPLQVAGYLLDITNRKEAEQVLREQQMSLNHAQAIAKLGSWESHLASGEERWSDEVFRILGYAPCAFPPSQARLLERIHAEDRDRVQQRLKKAVDGESGFDTEFRVVRPDGQQRFVRCRGEIARNHRGQGEAVIGTLLDFTERKQTEISLEQSRQTLRELARHLQSIREEERGNIARQIHDELGQSLAAMKIDIVRLRSRLGAESPQVNALLESMLGSVGATIETVQRVMEELRPSILDDLGLVPATEWQIEQFQRRTGILCSLSTLDSELDLSKEATTALFRILQETLTNVARHANARQVRVELSRMGPRLVLKVTDDGMGISSVALESNRSLGILGMRERAQVFGGQVDIERGENGGTSVRVSLPLAAATREILHV